MLGENVPWKGNMKTSENKLSNTSMMMKNELFCSMVDQRMVLPYFQPGPLSEILTIVNLRRAARRIWACAEPEFRLWWMKLCSSDNHYINSQYITAVPIMRLLKTPFTICYYHVTYAFQSESTLYSCLNVKEHLAQNRRDIWSLLQRGLKSQRFSL